MALRKIDEADLRGGGLGSRPAKGTGQKKRTKSDGIAEVCGAGLGGRGADQPKAPVRKMAKFHGIAESWGGSEGSVSLPAESSIR